MAVTVQTLRAPGLTANTSYIGGVSGTAYFASAGGLCDIALADVSGALSAGWSLPASVTPTSAQITWKSAIPFIIAPTGTMANNGAITLGTALPTTYSGGAYVYLPAGAIVASSAAGWYWTVFSSTTVGIVYNTLYTQYSGVPAAPPSNIAFATTGPGAYTGATAAQTGPQIVLPVGTMLANSNMTSYILVSNNNTAGAKTVTIACGGTNLYQAANTTNIVQEVEQELWNRGAVNSQVVTALAQAGYGVGTGANQYLSINFGASATWSVALQIATATDYIVLEAFELLVIQ